MTPTNETEMMYKLTKNKNMKLLSWNCHGSLPDEYTSLQDCPFVKCMKHIRNDDVDIICTNMPQSPGKNKKQREEFYSYMENLNNDGFFSTIDVYKRHNGKLKENLPMLTFFSKRLKGRVERVDLFDKFEIEYDYTNERHKALKYIDVHFINDKRGGFYLINTYVRPKFWNRIMDDIWMYLESFIIDYPYVICGDFNASVDETDIFEGDAAICNDTMNDQGEYMEDFIFTYDLNDNGKNAGYTNLNGKTGKRTRIDYILSSGCSDNAIEGKVKTLSDSGVFSERGHPHVPLMFYDMERVRDDSGNWVWENMYYDIANHTEEIKNSQSIQVK
jgi:hypothetical protein